MNQELDKWKNVGVRGHFEGELPWFQIEEFVVDKLSKVVGAKPSEVAVMSTLTTNLHLLMVSFYQPNQKRFKILIEENPFPSDMMAMLSQLKYHEMDPKEALLQIGPREGEHWIRTEDILELIEKEGDSIAVILLSGVHFLSGQAFELEKITKLGHEKGCFVGLITFHSFSLSRFDYTFHSF
jgi:kynureninase